MGCQSGNQIEMLARHAATETKREVVVRQQREGWQPEKEAVSLEKWIRQAGARQQQGNQQGEN